MDLIEQILSELSPLVLNGLWVSIICTVLFMIFKFPEKWNKDLKNLLMHLIILIVGFIWALLVAANPDWPIREKIVLWIKIVAFSFLFYELAGRYLIKKIFSGYRIKTEKKIEELKKE